MTALRQPAMRHRGESWFSSASGLETEVYPDGVLSDGKQGVQFFERPA